MNSENNKDETYEHQEHFRDHAHLGEVDASMFAEESDVVVGPNRALGVFGRGESAGGTVFMNPALSEDRSVGVMGMSASQFSRMSMAEETNSFHVAKKAADVTILSGSGTAAPSSTSVTSFPERPCFLVRTHFKANFDSKDFSSTISFIQASLETFEEFDFSFFPPAEGEMMWKGKHIRSSKSCEVYIRVFADCADQYIVEANRVKGESKPFMSFFKDFKAIVSKIPAVPKMAFLAPLPSQQPVSDEQFLTGIKPIFHMASDACMEPRLEGVKMLCELSTHETPLLRLDPCVSQVTKALQDLVEDEMEDVRQHAIMAVSNFVNLADIPSYKSLFIRNSRLLKEILLFAQDAPAPVYDSIQARRECAHILYMLSEFDAAATLSSLEKGVGANGLQQWISSAAHISDNRLKSLISSAGGNFLKAKAGKK